MHFTDLPPWCREHQLRYQFSLPKETPSNNVIKGMHWSHYRQLRLWWRVQVLSRALVGRLPAAPLPKAALLIVRYSAGTLDWDNAYGGLKPLLDCFVARSAENPDGLGLIQDDSPEFMPYPPIVIQAPEKRKQGRTEVKIYAVD
jgi:hypothetical protein